MNEQNGYGGNGYQPMQSADYNNQGNANNGAPNQTRAQPYYGEFNPSYSQGGYQQPPYSTGQGGMSAPMRENPAPQNDSTEKKVKSAEPKGAGISYLHASIAALLLVAVAGIIGFFVGRSLGSGAYYPIEVPPGAVLPDVSVDELADHFSGGVGTEDDPFIVTTADQLRFIAEGVNGEEGGLAYLCYKLDAPIDLGDEAWTPIGCEYYYDDVASSYSKRFYGKFDGGGHVISNLRIDMSDDYIGMLGLFGSVAEGASIRNLTVENFSITGFVESVAYVGGIAGSSDGEIIDCEVKGEINITSSGTVYAGGIVGHGFGDITGCLAEGEIRVESDLTACVGGLAGRADCNVTDSSASVHVYALTTQVPSSWPSGTYAGGLVGTTSFGSTSDNKMDSCTADGKVEAFSYGNCVYAGALVGDVAGTVENCQGLGGVYAQYTGSDDMNCYATVGGIAGYANGAIFKDCSSSGNVGAESTSHAYSGGIVGRCLSDEVTVEDCYTTATVGAASSGNNNGYNSSGVFAGGIVGIADVVSVKRSYAEGEYVRASADGTLYAYAGGIIGGTLSNIESVARIENCYSVCDVYSYSNNSNAGGIAGLLRGSIENSYSASVTEAHGGRNSRAGGLVGACYSSSVIANSYACERVVSTSDFDGDFSVSIGALSGEYCDRIENCYVLDTQVLEYDEYSEYEITVYEHGDKIYMSDTFDASFYTVTLGWDSSVWDLNNISSGYGPVFKSDDSSFLPIYIPK